MLIRSRDGRKRSGTAAVEAALVLPVMMYAILGAIEFTRMIQVKQILENAVREGGRAASTGQVLAGPYVAGAVDPNGAPLNLAQIPPYSGQLPGCEVELLVLYYIQNAGLYHTVGTSAVTVTNSGSPTAPHSPAWVCTATATVLPVAGVGTYTSVSTGSAFDPAAAAAQLDNIAIDLKFQFKNNSWLPLYWFYGSGLVLSAHSDWLSARDQPVQGSYAIPTLP